MRELLVLGGGTAGTMIVNKLRRRLDPTLWRITVVDRDDAHHYQPGYLMVPFGTVSPTRITRSRHAQITDGVRFITGEIDVVDPDRNEVRLQDGTVLEYEQLVIATGTTPRPEETPGVTGALWRRSVHEFYTLEGATLLRDALSRFDRGRLVVHITEMPIKCPVAPLEFTFLAESWLRDRGLRDAVEIVYVTPLSGAFTRPIAAERLDRKSVV
jgi:sulfide:quinone oxidoreductase